MAKADLEAQAAEVRAQADEQAQLQAQVERFADAARRQVRAARRKQEAIDARETELAAKRERVDAAMRCLAEATGATLDEIDMWQELSPAKPLHGDDAAVAGVSSISTQPETATRRDEHPQTTPAQPPLQNGVKKI